MLTKSDHGYVRTPRDLSRCVKALSEAAKATTREAQRRAVNELGLHPEAATPRFGVSTSATQNH